MTHGGPAASRLAAGALAIIVIAVSWLALRDDPLPAAPSTVRIVRGGVDVLVPSRADAPISDAPVRADGERTSALAVDRLTRLSPPGAAWAARCNAARCEVTGVMRVRDADARDRALLWLQGDAPKHALSGAGLHMNDAGSITDDLAGNLVVRWTTE